MGDDKRKSFPERQQTDESLRAEREKTDGALALKRRQAEVGADRLVSRARDTADAVLDAARDKADSARARDTVAETSQVGVEEERAAADEVVRAERAAADATLLRERAETAQALADLLPLERQKTDRYLLTERARSDDAVSHRDDFLGIVSHDLRNLLGGIAISAQVLLKATSGDRPELAEAARIQRYAARMNRLIGDLLDVASIEAGKLAVTPVAADFGAVLHEAVDLFRGAASEHHLDLSIETLEGDCEIAFDHDRMLQVLANLISNAIKFTPAGGRIVARCKGTEHGLRCSIQDTGRGIPDDMREAVFNRFWQVAADGRGLGLGLYIARCIVEAHGGAISAASPPGESGATFTLTLPRGS